MEPFYEPTARTHKISYVKELGMHHPLYLIARWNERIWEFVTATRCSLHGAAVRQGELRRRSVSIVLDTPRRVL